MSQLDDLLNTLPDAAKDLRLNLQSVLSGELLSPDQAYGAALASAYFVRSPRLRDALLADAPTKMSEGTIDDAKAALDAAVERTRATEASLEQRQQELDELRRALEGKKAPPKK